MLVYQCRQCGQLMIGGLVNEFNEHFCNEKCYEEYCEAHHYTVHMDRLEVVKTALDD